MILVVTEKNNAAQKIAELLGDLRPKADKVYNTPVYRFSHEGQEWVSIGLRGHILNVDFANRIEYSKRSGWQALDEDGNVIGPADIPDSLDKPPFKKRRPFYERGVYLKDWKLNMLPYLVYAPIAKSPAEKDIIRTLKNLAKKADEIIIATDFDREGELIGADAVEMVCEVSDAPISRARYSALIKKEIEHAFDNLVELDVQLAQAGESRRYIDLIWGAVLTRYLTIAKYSGFGNVRSAGRVQTPTLALIVARERERLAFVPEDYWVINGMCATRDAAQAQTPQAKTSADGEEDAAGDSGTDAADGTDAAAPSGFKVSHKKGRFSSLPEAQAAFERVEGADSATVVAVDKKSRQVAAPAPFNTTSLQTAASAIGITPARTMRIAESLYMNGYISYPRVDNTVYPAAVDFAASLKMLCGNPAYEPYCRKLLSQGRLTATRGKMQTTDHPPIHPTGCANPSQLRADEWKLYNLIARRFMATLSGPATIEATKVELDVEGEPFVAKGDSVLVPGFREIYPYGAKKDEELPVLAAGDVLSFSDPELLAKQTEPPARYSQGRLIQEMESHGLGTKSTRHSTIERLMEVNYIQNNPIEPTQLGMAVIDALGQFAPKIVSPDMTSELEHEMSEICDGQLTLDGVVGHSRDLLADVMDTLIPKKEEVGAVLSEASAADAKVGVCPKCGHDLALKQSAKNKSRFIGCTAWPDCDVTYPVPDGRLRKVEALCPECGGAQIEVQPFRSKPYTVCIDPMCPTNREPNVDVGACKVCEQAGKDSRLIAQKNPKTLKRFIRCQNYEECQVSYPLPRTGKINATDRRCEHCGAPIVAIDTQRGVWELCPNLDCPGREKKEGKAKARKGAKGRRGATKKASA